jgi:hypothetical protein
VYVKEETRNEITLNKSYIVNITQVEIRPYSSNSSATPNKATIVGLDEKNLEFNIGTKFNLLLNLDLRIEEKVANNSGITTYETQQIYSSPFLFLILRSNFEIDQMELTSEYSSISSDIVYFMPIYIQEKWTKFTNLHISVSGRILLTFDPSNAYLEHISVDFTKNIAGFNFHSV